MVTQGRLQCTDTNLEHFKWVSVSTVILFLIHSFCSSLILYKNSHLQWSRTSSRGRLFLYSITLFSHDQRLPNQPLQPASHACVVVAYLTLEPRSIINPTNFGYKFSFDTAKIHGALRFAVLMKGSLRLRSLVVLEHFAVTLSIRLEVRLAGRLRCSAVVNLLCRYSLTTKRRR